MKTTRRAINEIRTNTGRIFLSTRLSVFSCALLAALSGCTTYVEERPARVVVAPEPPPAVVQVEPAPAPAPVVIEAPTAPAVVVIQSESDFYEPLAPHGRWLDVAGYGRVWMPNGVAADWRPYADGHWERTEAGWFWVSDEPWAWAAYHYGRWDSSPELGWFWIPQTQWAPAWVAWRRGGDYVGWAPLPPRERFSRGVRVQGEVNPAPASAFVFVEERRFTEHHRPATLLVNNTTIINRTTVINNTTIVNKTVVNEGPPVAAMEKAGGHPLQAMKVRDLRHSQEAAATVKHPAAPPAAESKPAAPRPASTPARPAVAGPAAAPAKPPAETRPVRPAPAPSPAAPVAAKPEPPRATGTPPAAAPVPARSEPGRPATNRPPVSPSTTRPQPGQPATNPAPAATKPEKPVPAAKPAPAPARAGAPSAAAKSASEHPAVAPRPSNPPKAGEIHPAPAPAKPKADTTAKPASKPPAKEEPKKTEGQ
jgi:hypothetical protein